MVSRTIPRRQLLRRIPVDCGNPRSRSKLDARFCQEEDIATTDGLNVNHRIRRKPCETFGEATDAVVDIDTVLRESLLMSGLAAATDAEEFASVHRASAFRLDNYPLTRSSYPKSSRSMLPDSTCDVAPRRPVIVRVSPLRFPIATDLPLPVATAKLGMPLRQSPPRHGVTEARVAEPDTAAITPHQPRKANHSACHRAELASRTRSASARAGDGNGPAKARRFAYANARCGSSRTWSSSLSLFP
jgi:hypothetical protein